MKGPISSFWVSSYQLTVSNLQNQSVTYRQTDRTTTTTFSRMHAEG